MSSSVASDRSACAPSPDLPPLVQGVPAPKQRTETFSVGSCILSHRAGMKTCATHRRTRTTPASWKAKAKGRPLAVPKPATQVPMPLPTPADTAPRPSHIVLWSGGATVTVHTVPQTPCRDCVTPIMKRVRNIKFFERSRPKTKVQKAFSKRLMDNKSLALHLCKAQPQGREAATMPTLSIAPRRPISTCDQELFISSCMVSRLAGTAPPS
mmetsp:Transcript_52276/g.138079  ORF Transcript_52276/g.138079 Transcript_52276/m.138079 type:complete len:211 (-) Transcript_52276:50-682(-)